jgi:hypothetical protein
VPENTIGRLGSKRSERDERGARVGVGVEADAGAWPDRDVSPDPIEVVGGFALDLRRVIERVVSCSRRAFAVRSV